MENQWAARWSANLDRAEGSRTTEGPPRAAATVERPVRQGVPLVTRTTDGLPRAAAAAGQ